MKILFILFALLFPVNAGIFPYNDQAFPAWGWQVSRETPSLYFDIQREFVYKIGRIDYDSKTDQCIIYPFWVKVK